MAYVAPQNKLAGLAAALSGTAKGMNDFQQVQMQQNQMAEQKRQFDENLALGFKRLDEQIRQFDQSDATTKELAELSRELQVSQNLLDRDLTREEGAAQRATALRQTGMQTAQRDRALKAEQAALLRTHYVKSDLSMLDNMGYANLGAAPGLQAGQTPEDFQRSLQKWNSDARVLAIDVASAEITDREVTEADIQSAMRRIENAPERRKQLAAEQSARARSQAMARGLPVGPPGQYGELGTVPVGYSGKTRHQKNMDGTLGLNVRIPNREWNYSWRNSTIQSPRAQVDPRVATSALALSDRVQNVTNKVASGNVEATAQMDKLVRDVRDVQLNFPGLYEKEVAEVMTAMDNEIAGMNFLSGDNYVDMDTVDYSTRETMQSTSQSQTDNQAQVQQMIDEGMTEVEANRAIIDQVNAAKGNQVSAIAREPSLDAIRQQNPNLSVTDAIDILREQRKDWDAGAPARQRAENEAKNEQFRRDLVGYRDDFTEAWYD